MIVIKDLVVKKTTTHKKIMDAGVQYLDYVIAASKYTPPHQIAFAPTYIPYLSHIVRMNEINLLLDIFKTYNT